MGAGSSTTVTLRCTAKLLDRLKVVADPAPASSTTILGDWTTHLVHVGRQQLVILVAERTLLPILIPARGMRTLVPRFLDALREVLEALDIPPDAIQRELDAMREVTIARTNSKRILGSLNDFAYLTTAHLPTTPSLHDIAFRLSDTPCGPLRMQAPRDVTRQLFADRLAGQ